MTIPYALSIHHFISSVGADAGFAAIIGLALLVLLLFAQARETASLRQRTLDAEENLRRLELYIDQVARRPAASAAASGPVVTPAPASARAAVAAGAGAPVVAARPSDVGIPAGDRAAIPYAPAGVGAPALAAATRLIPGPDPISIRSLRVPGDDDANDAGGDAVPVGAPATAGAAVAAGTMAPDRAAAAAAGSATASPPARGAVTPPLAPFPPPPSTPAAGGNGVVPRSPSEPGERPPARVRLFNGEHAGPARELPPLRRGGQAAGPDEGSRIGRGVIAAAAVLVAAIVVVAVLVISGGGNSGTATKGASASATTGATTRAKASKRRHGAVSAPAPAPATITVAVLNGTNTTNLAHDVMSKLGALGYKQGGAETATDQTVTSTIVSYLPGDRAQALVVAKSLNLPDSSVQAVSPSNQSVACAASASPCADQVVVDVGTDLDSYAAAASSSAAVGNNTATSGA